MVWADLGQRRRDLRTGIVLSVGTTETERAPPVHRIWTRWLILEQGTFPGPNLCLREGGE